MKGISYKHFLQSAMRMSDLSAAFKDYDDETDASLSQANR
jgi:hypothetical protein